MKTYSERVTELEDKGLTTSDAQGVVDAEDMRRRYTICFDTICTGYEPIKFDDEPAQFATEAEAQAEINSDPEFYEDCFICTMEEIGHKTIYTGDK